LFSSSKAHASELAILAPSALSISGVVSGGGGEESVVGEDLAGGCPKASDIE
jgi:hypothetical protein